MHLAIQQGVDKINSLQADMLLSQEIDIELNKSMIRFINTKYGKNNKYGKGFEESQKRIDDLRTLVREYIGPTTYKEAYDATHSIDQFKLPFDYMYLINQRSEVFINNCQKISWFLDEGDETAYFMFPLSGLYTDQLTGQAVAGTTSGFIQSLRMIADPDNLSLGDVDVFGATLSADLLANNYSYPADLSQLRSDILDPSNWASGFEIYWETYGQLNMPGSFIIIVDTVAHPWFHWDASVANTVSGSQQPTQIIGSFENSTGPADGRNPLSYSQFTDDALGAKRVPATAATRIYADNKFIQQDDIFTLIKDPFNTTKHTSPLTTIRQDYIDLYTSDIFIIDKVKITYIRKPQEISLTLGIDCELPEHTHQEIVDMTVSSILEGISDPRYQTHQIEVGKNE